MFRTKAVQQIKKHILCSIAFSPENRVVYEIMWENVVESYRPQMAIKNTAHEHCMPGNKSKTTHNQNTKYSSLSHGNNCHANAAQRYVICTSPSLWRIRPSVNTWIKQPTFRWFRLYFKHTNRHRHSATALPCHLYSLNH